MAVRVWQSLICDNPIHAEREEEGDAIQHVLFQFPLLRREWEGDLCEPCLKGDANAYELAIGATGRKIKNTLVDPGTIREARGAMNGNSDKPIPTNGAKIAGAQNGDARTIAIECEGCGETVHGSQGYAGHWRNKHEAELGEWPGYGDFKCPDCKIKKPTIRSLEHHFRVDHEMPADEWKPRHRKALELV